MFYKYYGYEWWSPVSQNIWTNDALLGLNYTS